MPHPPPFTLQRGSAPLLISIPHGGTQLPPELAEAFSDEARRTVDTDWHLERLYAFGADLGASVLAATVSRYAIDLNRPPDDRSLYPGQTTTGLCPTESFRGIALYRPGRAPDGDEIARRRRRYWQPYHDALQAELLRLRARHGQVLLWEAHSIASVLPRLFEGRLPDLNFGTHSGASCGGALFDAVRAPLDDGPEPGRPGHFSHAVNARFKGGHITRHYGQPRQGIHAIQLEMCQCLYMDEAPPFDYRPDLARGVQPLLRALLEAGLRHLRAPG